LEIAVRYSEADRLGGDYATVQPKPNGNIFLAMCDACGHGIAAALLAARVNSFVRDHVEQSRDLCDLAESLNRFIFDNFYLSGAFATFLAAEIRPEQQEILLITGRSLGDCSTTRTARPLSGSARNGQLWV
jgi:serine phosphatase RsbU (regulator of sigma subunit)